MKTSCSSRPVYVKFEDIVPRNLYSFEYPSTTTRVILMALAKPEKQKRTKMVVLHVEQGEHSCSDMPGDLWDEVDDGTLFEEYNGTVTLSNK